jgi:hypothetical protein
MADKSRSFVQQPRGPQVAGSRRAGDRKRRKNAPAGRGLCDITPLRVRFLASIANVEDPATVSPPVALVLPWQEAICGLFSSDFPDQYLSRWRRQLRLFFAYFTGRKKRLTLHRKERPFSADRREVFVSKTPRDQRHPRCRPRVSGHRTDHGGSIFILTPEAVWTRRERLNG